MPLDLDHAHRVAVEAAEAAGALLRDGARTDIEPCADKATGDIVTELDVAAERLITDRIRLAFPQHRIMAEEAGLLDGPDRAHVWLVDPLDGTNNLAIGLHTYVVGIALCESREAVVGVVHDPVAGRTWSAIRGRGLIGPAAASRARRRCHPVHHPLVAWTQGHAVLRDDLTARSLRIVLESRARRVLQLWAPLLSWVMLARGDIDAFVGYHAEEVDLPAGLLIARESGLAVRGLDGSSFDDRIDQRQEDRSFVAGSPEMIDDVLRWLDLAGAMRPELARLLPR
jgi:myo-inositol-1(or 4)-monophosphatase